MAAALTFFAESTPGSQSRPVGADREIEGYVMGEDIRMIILPRLLFKTRGKGVRPGPTLKGLSSKRSLILTEGKQNHKLKNKNY